MFICVGEKIEWLLQKTINGRATTIYKKKKPSGKTTGKIELTFEEVKTNIQHKANKNRISSRSRRYISKLIKYCSEKLFPYYPWYYQKILRYRQTTKRMDHSHFLLLKKRSQEMRQLQKLK